MTVSGQPQTNYTFDSASRLNSITQGAASVSFGYDSNGRRISMTLPNGVTATYGYDAASELTSILYQGGSLAPSDLEYTYDLAGRRVGVSGSLASTQLPAAVSSAVYNADNQLTQWGTTAMSYDLNGNTLNDGTNSYVWDARNRLVSADNSGATFSYDPLGRRTGKSILGANSNFLYDGVNPVQELDGATVTANLLGGLGVDERFARTDSSGTADYLTDALGSTIALTDTSGNSAVQYSYSPFGSISITGTTNNSYTYTGRETDGLGIDYYRARYYNPQTGRFLSEDPMGFQSGGNLYEYAGDDPVDKIDPTGCSFVDCEAKKQELSDAIDELLRRVNENKAGKCDKGHPKAIGQALNRALNALAAAAACLTEQDFKEIENWIKTMFQDIDPTKVAIGAGIIAGGAIILICPECIVLAPVFVPVFEQ